MNDAERLSMVERSTTELAQAVDRLTVLLTGGLNPTSGLIVMVDRLIVAENARRYWSRWAVGVAVAAFLTSIGALLGTLVRSLGAH